jgi:hypothetical protein
MSDRHGRDTSKDDAGEVEKAGRETKEWNGGK